MTMLLFCLISAATAFHRGCSTRSLPSTPQVKRHVAPSGIDALPLVEQSAVFAGIFGALGASTASAVYATKPLREVLPSFFTKTTFLIGAVYVAAGIAHFGVEDAFLSIYPPQGTWGLWYLPGSPEFHVEWTGIAEVLGGAGLLAGGIASEFFGYPRKLASISAACLFALTVAVTPANIYMYTHGAIMVGAGPDGPLPLEFHYIRFAMQVVLLTILASEVQKVEPSP